MNPLLCTDVYKLGHMEQYAPGTTEVYSYLEARKQGKCLFFGLQYYLKNYLSKPITKEDADELCSTYELILGPIPTDVESKIYSLAELGYWPVKIKAVPEGTVLENKNVLLTIVNTNPDFYWCVGFLESLLLKVWAPITVATYSLKYKELVQKYSDITCDNEDHLPFAVHDFGYRGVSSEESAALLGASHLINFLGSDTVPAVAFLEEFYPREEASTFVGLSVPASEHSVMCSYEKDNEFAAFDRMLELYPKGIVSIVSDTYDFWKIMTDYCQSRREKILSREGKVVFRPDSGDPIKVVCGDKDQGVCPYMGVHPSFKGALEILAEVFGYSTNSKGYKVLNPKVGLIYGDGMYYERFEQMLETMKELGFASSNLVIGVGGLLLQQHSRDELGFAMKATRIIKNRRPVEIFKDPATDPGKKSKKGLMILNRDDTNDNFYTIDQQESDEGGQLVTVFENGKILKEYSLEQVRRQVS